MRAREYLIEYNRQKTEQNYGDKIVMIARRDPTIPQEVRKVADNLQLVDIVLSQLEKADPTKNKEYTQGLAKLYANGGLKMEDASSTLADYLTKFHKLKVRRMIPSPRNDFLRYTSVGDFMSVVDEYPDPDAKEETDKGSAKEYYNDADIRVIQPVDQTASCYYGQGTRWCTAGRTNNMFDHYHNDGPLYVVLPKAPAYPGEKYQFHFESGQYMDEQDNPENLKEIISRHPSIKKAFAKQGKQFGILSLMLDEEINRMATQGNTYIQAQGVNQGNGIVTVSLNEPNSDVEEFSVNSRIVNLVNAASSRNDFGIPMGEPGEGNIYIAYAVIDTNSGKDNTYLVWGEVAYDGHAEIGSDMYYRSNDEDGDYDTPSNPTMARCVSELKQLIYDLIDTEGDYDLDDPFEEQRKVLNTLKQKYGD